MANTGNINECEQCGRKVAETCKCNACGMVVCLECLRKTRNRTPPCHCVWDDCNGWLEPTMVPDAAVK